MHLFTLKILLSHDETLEMTQYFITRNNVRVIICSTAVIDQCRCFFLFCLQTGLATIRNPFLDFDRFETIIQDKRKITYETDRRSQNAK